MNIIDASCASCGAAPPLKIRQPERDERVEALLKTNGVPQDIERPALEEYARGAPLALLQYDAKITALKQELELAVRERAKLQRHYEDAKTLLHPIRTLPSDVLREVFSWCIPTRRELFEDIKEDTFDYCSLNASNAPWSLSQVSKGWRTVALSSPLLWRTVALTVPDNSIRTSKLGKFGFNLALLLSRSNNADLHVILECPPDKVKLVPFAVSIPLQISASRWQSLFYDNNPILERVLSDMHFDRLQSVDVRCSQRTEDSKVAPIRYAPQLWQVSLLYGGTTVLRTIAWGNLSDFECTAPLLKSDVKTLALMTNLVWLRLNDLDDTTPTYPHTSIPLPKLTNLTLNSKCFPTLFRFAAAFNAPLLTSLSLFYYDSADDPPSEIASLEVPKSMPRLDILALSLPLISRVSDALAVWLRHALNLETFEVWCSSKEVADGTLFDKLIVKPDNDSDVILPRLAFLTIHTNDEEALNDEAKQLIASIMQSRVAEADGRFSLLEEVTVNGELIVRDDPIHGT